MFSQSEKHGKMDENRPSAVFNKAIHLQNQLNAQAQSIDSPTNTNLDVMSRGSGMTSGNFCFADDAKRKDQIQLMEAKDQCQRLEMDKSRLNNQLNAMLKNYKELELKYKVKTIEEQDEDGL